MDGLRGVLLEMRPHDPDFSLAVLRGKGEPAGAAEGRLVLADLVALREVGIEVVLAGEDGPLGDLAVEREAEQDRHLDSARVRDGQRTGMREADGTRVRVLRRAVLELAAAEHLRACLEVRVHLEPDHELPLTRAHRASPWPRAAPSRRRPAPAPSRAGARAGRASRSARARARRPRAGA